MPSVQWTSPWAAQSYLAAWQRLPSGNSSSLGTLPSTSPVQPGAQGNQNTPSVIAQNGEAATTLQHDNIRRDDSNGTVNGAGDPDYTGAGSTGNSAAGTDAPTSPASTDTPAAGTETPPASTGTLPANAETPPATQPTPPAQTEAVTGPTYAAPSQRTTVAHDQLSTLDSSLFTGTDPKHLPAYIRINRITRADGTQGDADLVLRPADGTGDAQPVQAGQEIALADLGRLAWNARSSQGGTLTFTPLDEDHQPYSGTEAQTLGIHESPTLPVYSETSLTMLVPHDGQGTLQQALEGTDDSQAPPMIRIGTIQEMDDTDTEHSALYLQETGGTRDELHEGDTVSQAHIAGVAPQTVQIHESPEAPTWTTDTTHLKLPLSGEFHFSEEVFTGTSAAHAPAFIRVASLTGADTASGAAAPTLELRKDDGSVTTITTGNDGTVISREDFGRLHWNGHGNQGGTFLFEALDGDKFNIITSEGVLSEHRVQMEPGSSQITYIIESAPIGQPLLLDGLQHSVPALI